MEKKTTLLEVAIDKIGMSNMNPRGKVDESYIKELAESIREKGLLQPLTVRPTGFKDGTYEIVCGECRYRAAKMIGLKEIAVLVRDLDDRETLEIQLIENLQRKDIHPLEEAEGYEALMKKHGYLRAEDIAVKVGKSAAYVYGRIKLCDLIPDNRKLFYAGKFSPSLALLIARVPQHLQKKAGKDIAEGDWQSNHLPLNYGQARNYIRNQLMLRISEAPFSPKDLLAGKLACVDCPKRTINEKLLFPDMIKDDRCTDPKCWEEKKKAHTQIMISNAERAGKKVLSAAEAEKIFAYGETVDSRSRYLKIDAHPGYGWGIKDDKKTFRQLLKKAKADDVEVVLAPRNGKLIALVERKKVEESLRAAGIIKEEISSHQSVAAAQRKKEQLRRAVLVKTIAAIGDKIDAEVKGCQPDKVFSFWPVLAKELVESAEWEATRGFVQSRNKDLKKHDEIYKALKTYLGDQAKAGLPRFCLEVLMFRAWKSDYYNRLVVDLARNYKIDTKKIAAAVKTELKDKGKKKGKA